MFSGRDIQFFLGDSFGVNRFISVNQSQIDSFCTSIVINALFFGIPLDSLKKYIGKILDDNLMYYKDLDFRLEIDSLKKRISKYEKSLDVSALKEADGDLIF